MTKYNILISKPNKLLNCLLGGAVGDALGLPFEGLSAKRTQKLFRNHQAYNLVPFIRGGMVSDDTEHAVMTVQAFIQAQGNQDTFRKSLRMHLRLWLLGLPAGIGMATGRALFKLWVFLSNSGVFSAGNGGAMRSAVLGIMVEDLAELREFVSISTNITHTDPKAVEGAMVVALSAWFNAYKADYQNPDNLDSLDNTQHSKQLLEFLIQHIQCPELTGYLQSAYKAVVKGKTLNDYMLSQFQQTQVTGYMYHTIPAVMFAYFKYPFEPVKGLQCLIKAGGDVDTTCAIAGGIWGVNYGEQMFEQIEGKWLEPKITPKFLQQLSNQIEHDRPRPLHFGGVITLLRNLAFLAIVLLHGLRRLLPPY